MSTPTWHEVVPKIIDPDLAPPQGAGPRRGGPAHQHANAPGGGPQGYPPGYPPGAYPAYGAHGPEKARGFFQEHKFAIIVAVVVLAVVLVVLYLYLSQKGKRGDKGSKGRPPGNQTFGAGDGGDGPGGVNPEEERINNAELQKAIMMRQAARAAQQRAGRRPNDGVDWAPNDPEGGGPPEGFGPPRDPWQGEGNPQMPQPPFDPSYPPYGAFSPRGAKGGEPPYAPPAEGTGSTEGWNHAPPSGQSFAPPRSPPEMTPNRGGRPPQAQRTATTQQFQSFGANMPNPNRAGFASVDTLAGARPGQVEQRRVTWADGSRDGGGTALTDGRAPQGAVRMPKPPAPEKTPMADGGSGFSGGASSLFQQLTTSLEDEASGGQ